MTAILAAVRRALLRSPLAAASRRTVRRLRADPPVHTPWPERVVGELKRENAALNQARVEGAPSPVRDPEGVAG
jgi:hypothetical protein